MKSGMCIFRSSSGPWGLADLGSARPDKKVEGNKGKEASRRAVVLIKAQSKQKISREAVFGWAVGVQPSLRYGWCLLSGSLGSSLQTSSMGVVALCVSFAEAGEAPRTDWTLSPGNTEGLVFLPPIPPPKTKKQKPV